MGILIASQTVVADVGSRFVKLSNGQVAAERRDGTGRGNVPPHRVNCLAFRPHYATFD